MQKTSTDITDDVTEQKQTSSSATEHDTCFKAAKSMQSEQLLLVRAQIRATTICTMQSMEQLRLLRTQDLQTNQHKINMKST